MKRILIALCAVYPLFAFADIIATFNNGNIEDVTVVAVGSNEVVYKKGNTQKTIASSEVEGVLYDDGSYVSPPKNVIPSESVEPSSDDSWAIDNGSSEDAQSVTASTRRQKREKKESSGEQSEVGQAFKEAGVAIKDAFTTMFDAMGKKKEKDSSGRLHSTTESKQSSSPASDDGW